MPTQNEHNKAISDAELMIQKFKIMEDIIKRSNKSNDPSVNDIADQLKKIRETLTGKMTGFESLYSQIERVDEKIDSMKNAPGKLAGMVLTKPIDSISALKSVYETNKQLQSEYKEDTKTITGLIKSGQDQVEKYKSHLKNPEQNVKNEENKENIFKVKPT